MGVSLFLCLPRVRSVAPSRAFPQARLGNLFSFVSSVSLLMLAVHFTLPGGSVPATACTHTHVIISICCCGQYLWRGSGWFQAFFVSESCVFRQLARFALNLFVMSFRFCLRFS